MASSDKINQQDNSQNGDFRQSDEQTLSSGRKSRLPDFDKEWAAADPQHAPLLAESMADRKHRSASPVKADAATATGSSSTETDAGQKAAPASVAKEEGSDFSPRRRSLTLAALPFHHLIPLRKLAPAFAVLPAALVRPKTGGEIDDRRQIFWQTLVNAGISAKEAALLDDSIHCRLTDSGEPGDAGNSVNAARFELDWEVLFHDDLQGCAEMYQTELLVIKRRIYEAGDELRAVLEIRDDEFLNYLTDGINAEAVAVIETEHLHRWFLHNLLASFALTVSRFKENSETPPDNKKKRKTKTRTDEFVNYRTEVARRISSSVSTELEDTADSSDSADVKVYRLSLAEYWLDWQSAACAAVFDFDLLANLTDVRAMRFYELTKLWRLRAIAGTASDTTAAVALPNSLEIEYDRFAALMPLPRLRTDWEVAYQIREIIKPLKAAGYVKSFAVKDDWRGLNRAGRLVFKFSDDFPGSQSR